MKNTAASLLAIACIFAACLSARGDMPPQGDITKPEALDTLPGFKVELLRLSDMATEGSWISIAKDPKGRLLLGANRKQPISPITIKDGQIAKAEMLKLPLSEVMGMLFAFDSLYVNGHGKGPDGRELFGLWRCTSSKGGDDFDKVELLREWPGGGNDHGAHTILLNPDKKHLNVLCGNFVEVPKDLLPTSPHRNYADDLVLPRAEDGNGFGAGHKPPGGFVVRMDPDGNNCELIASGQRNTYGVAFNRDGELFGFDSDMEWDWGTPWYRPVRVYHVTSGADHVVRATFAVDIHALSAEENKKSAYADAGVKAQPYDIPLRALIARDVDGLLMAGRCISGDFIAHASYPVTGNAVAMGEAAGAAAVVAARTKAMPHDVPWSEVQAVIEKVRKPA